MSQIKNAFCASMRVKSTPQHSHEKPGVAVYACDPSVGEQRQTDPRSSTVTQCSQKCKLLVQ